MDGTTINIEWSEIEARFDCTLSDKVRQFVLEYLVDRNASAAARRAGYAKRSAGQQAERMLKKDEIRAAIDEGVRDLEIRTGVSQERVLQEMARLALSDIRQVFTAGGQLRSIRELPDHIAAAISSVEVVTKPGAEFDEDGNREIEYVHKIKLTDKTRALENLFKHMGMFEKDNSQRNPLQGLPAESLALLVHKLRDSLGAK